MNLLIKSNIVLLVAIFLAAPAQAASLPTVNVSCGEVITKSVVIGNDLNCPETTDYALRILGDNITVHGGGHKIVAPKAIAGIFAEGFNLKISNFISTGHSNGSGLTAHNAAKIHVFENDFSHNKNGITMYADKAFVDGVVIEKNKIVGSSEFGVRFTYAESGMVKNPLIIGNDLRNTSGWAIYVMASDYEVTGSDNNNFWGSANAYYLKDGTFSIHDADFSQQLIFKRTFFVDSAKYVSINNLNVSSRANNICTEERIGVDFYRVVKFLVKGLVSTSGDVGLVLETEKGVCTEGDVKVSTLANHIRAGISIVSYDTTQYCKIVVDTTGFCEPRKDIYIHKGTVGTFIHYVQPTICPDDINYSCVPGIPGEDPK